MTTWRKSRRRGRRGSALIAVLIVVSVLAAMATSALTFNMASNAEVETSRKLTRSLYLAEAALSETLAEVTTRSRLEEPIPSGIGNSDSPEHLSGGDYWATITDNGDTTFTVRATGSVDGSARTIEGLISENSGSIFDNALFAGNRTRDPNYDLTFSGNGASADRINGDVYSGGDISLEGDSTVSGEMIASGSINGGDGETGASRGIPDIPGMNYAVNNDFDVKSMFDSGSTYLYDDAGGHAYQMPEASPAHIFRKNPSDRSGDTASTPKDDYFLEDPYESVQSQDYKITLSGSPGDPGVDGSDKVYYIDGNLWIHNRSSYGFETETGDDGFRVTFVVNGNIYFSDNVKLEDSDNDAIAFIAIEDENQADSGNIYFGDPTFGTLEEMHAYMYAENNFYDYNLNSSGSAEVKVVGTMSAGNHVSITRDYTSNDGEVFHSKLEVDFDPRLSGGRIELPGIPGSSGSISFGLTYWREVATE